MDNFRQYKSGSHNGYTYDLLKSGGVGQDKYLAVVEALSIRTESYGSVSEAESKIKDLIEKTYHATFNKSQSEFIKSRAKSQAHPAKK